MYKEIAYNPRYSYKNFISHVDAAINSEFNKRKKPYNSKVIVVFEKDLNNSWVYSSMRFVPYRAKNIFLVILDQESCYLDMG